MTPTEFQQQLLRTVGQELLDLSHKQEFHHIGDKYGIKNFMFLHLDEEATSKQYRDVLSKVEDKVAEIYELTSSLKRKPKLS